MRRRGVVGGEILPDLSCKVYPTHRHRLKRNLMAKNKKTNSKNKYWAFKIAVITLLLSGGITIITEMLLDDIPVYIAALIVLALVLIGIITDIIGVAFASCEETPFISMASRKVKSAKHSLKLLKKADAVSSVMNDVVGDVCGIVSGAASASIVIKLTQSVPSEAEMWISVGMSALLAALTVGGKAVGKKIAMKNNVKIVEMIGKVVAFFHRERKNG